jgi:hypothetical protein
MRSTPQPRRGSSLLIVTILIVILAGLTASQLVTTTTRSRTVRTDLDKARALELAESGIDTVLHLANTVGPTSGPIDTGTVTLAGGTYRVTGLLEAESGQLVAEGRLDEVSVVLTVDVQRPAQTIHESFLKAIYAGNLTELAQKNEEVGADYDYHLAFGGGIDPYDTNGVDGDRIVGDVYSGGDLTSSDEARFDGLLTAVGEVQVGTPPESDFETELRVVPPPDLAAIDYANSSDIDVAAAFGGISSGMLPENDPAHIFYKNNPEPSLPPGASNGKDNYFLEDHHEPFDTFGRKISLAADGNEKIYYVDGNLLLHSIWTLSFTLDDPGAKVTFVVKGNIVFSDDLEYTDAATDMVAFIALADPQVADSGNIYIGDGQFGTVDKLEAILYAENDFKDNNVTAAGAAHFEINGGMLAGEHVDIQRDYVVSRNQWLYVPGQGWVFTAAGSYHSEMDVTFDARLADPDFVPPPGLPPQGQTSSGQEGLWEMISWSRSG